MNNKGFTLVELIATLVILAIVMSIGSYSIIHIINSSKEENYNLLIKHIKDASETFYQECKYANNSGISCNISNNSYTTTLGDLVTYGYLKGNSENNSNNFTLVNPNDENSIVDCSITVSYSNGKINVVSNGQNSTNSCPTSY